MLTRAHSEFPMPHISGQIQSAPPTKTSDRLCIKAAASCLGYYELDNDAKDGYYIIETKDGASAKAYCDMTNGGWTM